MFLLSKILDGTFSTACAAHIVLSSGSKVQFPPTFTELPTATPLKVCFTPLCLALEPDIMLLAMFCPRRGIYLPVPFPMPMTLNIY